MYVYFLVEDARASDGFVVVVAAADAAVIVVIHICLTYRSKKISTVT